MIELVGLRKEFGGLIAVDDVNLKIPAGEIFGLIGPNGAGKTTMIRMMCGLLKPTSGKININGIDVQQTPEEVFLKMGYLADFFSVYEDLTAWEYLDYFARAYKLPASICVERVNQILHEIGLENKRDDLIKGLSRGMKQRLGIGRSIIHQPRLLLLDEPASGLDPKARVELRNLLLSIRDRGTTVLISSHILPDLEGLCSMIGIMEKGRMLRSGSIESVSAAETSRRTVRLRWLKASDEKVSQVLSTFAEVTDLRMTDGSHAVFEFSGDDARLSGMLSLLVRENIDLVSFGDVKQTVEELYMKISHHEVN